MATKIDLVTIDPQVDFHPGGALPVAGADKDADRLAKMVKAQGHKLNDWHITLDMHNRIDVGHPLMWKDKKGQNPPPFTMISNADLKNKTWLPVWEPWSGYFLDYTEKLEAKGRYSLMVWPEHCLIGHPGAALYPVILETILTQIEFIKIGKMLSLSFGQSWDVLPFATKVFDGVCYQDTLGQPYLIVPGVAFVHAPELQGFKIIKARKQHNVITVVGYCEGQNELFTFVLNKTFNQYVCYREPIEDKDLNIAILKKQLAVLIPDDGKLKLKSLADGKERLLNDKAIDSDFQLSSEDNTTVFSIGNKLFKLTLK